MGMRARSARRRTASGKSNVLVFLDERENIPALVAAEAMKNLLVGLTLKLGVFSRWNGQRATKLAPFFLSGI
jgi:hypothetical protein